MRRRKAREILLQLLFQRDFHPIPLEELLASASLEDQDEYIRRTIEGIIAHQEEIDRIISERAVGWKLDRLVSVDRNILRLGIYELLYTDVPGEVVINEAVELSKKYSTEHSHIFINGILDRVFKERPKVA
ncbi:MAG: transcription antitermination factor NusB [Candidatus Acetothermia bacterium]|jgi:N utilization substance protein B|nr:transcription antitermination factor NusB [Candidatus Acetothermia bacterium]MDH7505817.1 transcription antitermination factor NusB [Candidatus Acetothermia bacterium]